MTTLYTLVLRDAPHFPLPQQGYHSLCGNSLCLSALLAFFLLPTFHQRFFCSFSFLVSLDTSSHCFEIRRKQLTPLFFSRRSPISTPNRHQPQNAGTTSLTNTLALLLTTAVITTIKTALVRISAMSLITAVELHMDTAEETVAEIREETAVR